jgi:hypothetical protein
MGWLTNKFYWWRFDRYADRRAKQALRDLASDLNAPIDFGAPKTALVIEATQSESYRLGQCTVTEMTRAEILLQKSEQIRRFKEKTGAMWKRAEDIVAASPTIDDEDPEAVKASGARKATKPSIIVKRGERGFRQD